MAVQMIILPSREAWLEHRKNFIGGSDAACVIGCNSWKSNVDLWEEKTGRKQSEDISDKPYVQYGTQAEMHLRGLFRLDFPEYQVEYIENNMFLNDRYPWAHASLDGWITDNEGRKGILEIKTTEILQSMQKEKWKGEHVPMNYYIQTLHYLMVTEFDFVILKAQLKTVFKGIPYLQTKHYFIERSEVEDDIKYLAESEAVFWENVRNDERPDLILPPL